MRGLLVALVLLAALPANASAPSLVRGNGPELAYISADATANFDLASFSVTRSCGRRGPAMHGTTAPRSTSMTVA